MSSLVTRQNWAKVSGGVVLLLMLSLQTSIAGMEIFSWLLFLLTLLGVFVVPAKSSHSAIIPGLILILLAILLVAVFSSVVLTSPELRNWEYFGFMRWIFLLLAYNWYFSQVLPSQGLVARGVQWWMVGLAIVGLYTVVQGLTGIDLFHAEKEVVPRAGAIWRATGPMSISITFASVAAMATSMVISWLTVMGSRKKWWQWIVVVLGVLSVVFTLSRATFVGMIVVSLLAAALVRPRWVPWVMGGLAVAIAVVLVSFDGVATRITSLFHLNVDHSTTLRLGLWKSYWAIFLDHPLAGVGLFAPVKLLPMYYARFGINETFYSHAHDNLLQWLAGSGIFAALAYIALSARLLMASWRGFVRSHSKEFKALALGTLLAQVVFHIEGLIECNFFDGEVNHQLIFWWALAIVLERLSDSRSRAPSA